MLVSLPKKFPSRHGQLIQYGPKLSSLMFHDSLSEFFFFEIVCCDGTQYIDKSNVSQFSKKVSFWSNMGPILLKIKQLKLTALEIFRMWCTSSTSVILANFPRKFSFGARGNSGKNYAILFISSLRIFLKLCSMMGYKRPKQCLSTFPKNSLLVERENWAQFSPKLCNLV